MKLKKSYFQLSLSSVRKHDSDHKNEAGSTKFCITDYSEKHPITDVKMKDILISFFLFVHLQLIHLQCKLNIHLQCSILYVNLSKMKNCKFII